MTHQHLEVEVALLAAEAEYLTELIDRGILPPDARREPTPGELRSGVRFAELDRIVVQAAALVMRDIAPVRDDLLTQLEQTLTAADLTPYGVVSALTRLGVDDFDLGDLEDTIAAQLTTVAQHGADEALAEATRQGFPSHMLPAVDAATDETTAAAAAHAARIATATVDRVVAPALEAAQRAATTGAPTTDVVAQAVTAAREASTAGVEDLARQGANVTHGIGRRDAQTAMPEPVEVYASELLDKNTCEPCADLDGHDYATLADGLADYPGAGGYIACDGGSRCRGTLVLVWPQEAGPTRNTPGFGPGRGPA